MAEQPADHPTEPATESAGRAYRSAWWSLALYPLSGVAAFVIGEGLFEALHDGPDDAPPWVVLVAGVPALIAFALPALMATIFSRRAVRAGHPNGAIPGYVAIAIAVAFTALNLLSYVVGLIAG